MIDWPTWSNSPELRKSVQILLSEWGRASRGGWPELGYPDKVPWAPPTPKPSATYNPDNVERIESAVRALVADLGHERAGKLLVWRYVFGWAGDNLVERYNEHFRLRDSKAQVLGRLDVAEWTVGCLL